MQQAGEVRVLDHIQPAGGRNRSPDTEHHERPGQGGGPTGGRAAGDERRQHDPQPHDKRPDPLGEQKAEQILPDRDLHRAAHEGRHALDRAGQRTQAERRGTVGEVDAVQQRQHSQQAQRKRAELGQCRLQPPAGQTAHKRQQAAVPLLPNEQQRQHEHRRQQDQVGEGIRNCGVQPLLRVVVNGRFIQTGIHCRRNFNVFQVVSGLVVLENRDARQLSGPGLHAVEEVAVPGHRVVLADQLGEQRVVQRKAVGIQRVGFVEVGLLVDFEQRGVFVAVALQIDAVAVGEVAVIVVESQQGLGLV